MKKLLLILLCLPMIGFGQACQYGSSTDVSEICDYIKGNSFASNKNADKALEMILDATNSNQRFAIKECSNISNAIATTYKGINYILYDKNFMNDIANNTNSWSKISILAHEIGHHVKGHTMSESLSLKENRDREIEADEYSGFVMYKLGASLKDAQIAIGYYAKDGDDSYSTHPARDKRLSAIAVGYNKAKLNANNDYSNLILTAEDYFYKAYNNSVDYRFKIENYTKCIRKNPNSNYVCDSYNNRGVAYMNLENYEDAIVNFNGVIEKCSMNKQKAGELNVVYRNRGLCYNELEKYQDAIADFTTAIRLEPNDAKAYDNRATSYILKGDYGEAIVDYTEAIKCNPKLARSYFNRAIAKSYLKLDNCSDFRKACDLGIESGCESYYKKCR